MMQVADYRPKYTVLYSSITKEESKNSSPKLSAYLLVSIPGAGDEEILEAVRQGIYVKAAEVLGDSKATEPEEVWVMLQNLDRSWTDRRDVKAFIEFTRSMMVGDIIYDHHADAWAFVATTGFEGIWQDEAISILTELL